MKKFIAVILLLMFFAQSGWATTTVFQDGVSPTVGYAGEIDARIISASTNEEDTSIIKFNTGGNTVIIRFDLSSIPSNATVSSATISFRGSEQNCTSGTHMKLTKILNPDNSATWSTWPTSNDGFNNWATWANKQHQATTVKWSVSGGASNFSDVNTGTAESTVAIPACAANAFYNFSATTMVSSWIASPSTNSGAFFIMDASQVAGSGQFDATAANRPTLSVTYTVPHINQWNGRINGALQ